MTLIGASKLSILQFYKIFLTTFSLITDDKVPGRGATLERLVDVKTSSEMTLYAPFMEENFGAQSRLCAESEHFA